MLGAEPPEGFNYELFLDENGQKISKSKGNGLTIEEWLAYASPESLSLFMFQKPRAAKRLYFDVIPKAVDEYFSFLGAYPRQADDQRLGNPVWHIHSGNPPTIDMPIAFTMLLNLASASNAHDKDVLWGFILRHVQGVTPESHPKLDELVGYAVRYYHDFVAPTKVFRAPDDGRARGARRARREAGDPARATPRRRRSSTPCSTWRAPFRATRIRAQGPRRRARRVGGVVRDALPDPARPGARARASAPSCRSTASPRRGR